MLIMATKKINKPTFIEVCAGCGGLSQGFINSGFNPIILNEIDKTCCDTLRLNHPNIEVVCESMETLQVKKYKNIDMLIGGVPCQSFSQAGMRKGLEDDRGNLIFTFANLLKTLRPKAFLIENVKGLVTHNQGNTFKTVIEKLSLKGLYQIKHKILNSNHYDVAQKRERVFIIGIRKDINIDYQFPTPLDSRPVLRDVLIDCPESEGYTYPETKKEIMDQIPPGGCWVNLPVDVQKQYMKNSYFSGGGKRGIARRLSMDEPCLTLTTSPCQKQTERCHPLETRPFTIREYARIQSFPDDFKFCGSIAKRYKQIGNAVPVKLAQAMANSLMSQLF
tara:strand:- start:560 stop:1561 length:1002 start_codon:yes stop_codon:yes gene_type:complete